MTTERFERLNEYERGWVAGFLEGEGSFYLQKPQGRAGDLRYPRVSASQKQREPLERIQALLGGQIYFAKPRTPRRWKDDGAWVWCLDGKGVADVMLDLRPHMSERRQGQIDACVRGEVRRPPKGAANPTARLTEDDVRYIRTRPKTQRALAAQFGVDVTTIQRAQYGTSWAHV